MAGTYSRLVELRRLLIKAHVKTQVIQDGCGNAAIAELLETTTDKILDALRMAGTAETMAQDALRETLGVGRESWSVGRDGPGNGCIGDALRPPHAEREGETEGAAP